MDEKKPLNKAEITDEALDQVAGGASSGGACKKCGKPLFSASELMVGLCYGCRIPEDTGLGDRP